MGGFRFHALNLGLVLLVFSALGLTAPAADTIYSWTDDHGVLHFSDQPPADEVTRFSKTEAATESDLDQKVEKQRSVYDQMVDDARRQTDQMESERKQAAEKAAAQRQEELQKQLAAKAHAERQRLEEQIDRLRRRALSPTFTQGMRQAQIKPLEERLQKLENDPEGYFGD